MATTAVATPAAAATTAFGLVVIGDEILSGRRRDAHLAFTVALLAERGLQLGWAEFVPDEPAFLTATLARAFARSRERGDVVLCCGGIGSTPDDHTRQCAAAALGLPVVAHPDAVALIDARIARRAAEQGAVFDADSPGHAVRRQMGHFPQGAQLLPNPYNQIPGFSVGDVHFMPGFPEMAHPMMRALLAGRYAHLAPADWAEHHAYVQGSFEADLTPLMQAIEADHPGVRVFSLPVQNASHPRGVHIELGVKGARAAAAAAFEALTCGLRAAKARFDVA